MASSTYSLIVTVEGQEIQNPQDIVKDPFVLEFVGIPEKQVYLEGELEDRLIANLQDFLLELLCKPLHNISYANKFIMQSDLN